MLACMSAPSPYTQPCQTGHPVLDVGVNQTFYTAKTIFKNNPLTVEDYRKILIDIIGVHNAFMFPSVNVEDESEENIPATEVPFYPDCKKDALVYNKTEHAAIDVSLKLPPASDDHAGTEKQGPIVGHQRTARCYRVLRVCSPTGCR
mgnify:CR=1 FL=1